ncbi:MAG TPA: hypothetical protein VFU21_33510 [Kofleriaceae bacterium]|nr:hypothetical protein [Kofleriaceae bacterium]
MSCAALLLVAGAACRRRTPTYHRDVAPILARHCTGCHSERGVSPNPRMSTYEQAVKDRMRIQRSVQRRKMPPWGADNTGRCGTWKAALWLDAGDIATIVSWVEAGTPAGEPADAPPPARREPAPFRADAAVDIGAPYRPDLGSASYRCFLVDPRLAEDRMLTAIRVDSSEPRIVAQVTLFALDEAGEAEAEALDAGESGAGYRCYGTARTGGARLVASWTWDAPVLRLPPGTGLRLAAGRRMVLQIHYDLIAAGLSSSSRTRVDLELERPGAVTEAAVLPLQPAGFQLEGGRSHVEVSAEMTIDRAATIHAVAPRMHTLGLSMQLDRVAGQEARCLANFNHWMFYRQRLFVYEEPVSLAAGDRLRATCAYTTINRGPIAMGEDIGAEECVAYLYVTR